MSPDMAPFHYSEGLLFQTSVFTAVICDRVGARTSIKIRVKCNSGLSEQRPFRTADKNREASLTSDVH